MKSFPFKKIDAFTRGLSSGNPCACIYLNSVRDISSKEMQQIAQELKCFVNEVIYLFPDEECFLLKYYSAECEVNFCGHGTVGIMYDLISNSADLLRQKIIRIKVKDVRLDVFNKIVESDAVFITAPPPLFHRLPLPNKEIAAALLTEENRISARYQTALINAGLNTLIVPLADLKTCLELLPDEKLLKEFCLTRGIDMVLVFTDEVADRTNKFRVRVFAPKYGYLEDPATGSGNSAFGNYLLQNNLWDGALVGIEQNSSYDLPNIIKLGTVIDNGNKNVVFGGAAVVKISGEYRLGGF